MKSFWSVIGVILVGLGVTLLHSAKQISTEYNDVSAFWGAVTVFAGAGAIYLSARSVGHEKHRGKYKTQPDLTEGVYVVHAVSKNNRKLAILEKADNPEGEGEYYILAEDIPVGTRSIEVWRDDTGWTCFDAYPPLTEAAVQRVKERAIANALKSS